MSRRSKSRLIVKPLSVLLVSAAIAAIAAGARGGHEAPVYPSYYPHEIAIEAVPLERVAGLLRDHSIGAYVGVGQPFPGELPASIRAVESLGGFIVVGINPASPSAKDDTSACAATKAVVRDMAGRDGFVFHPYPVTPFHGDYLYHVDRAEASKARLLKASTESTQAALTVRADGALASLVRTDWRTQGPEWDVAVEEVDAAGLLASAITSLNGWLGPPWNKTGWFQAALVLADASDNVEARHRAAVLLAHLETGSYHGVIERINAERELVAALASGCRKVLAGYTVKRQYFSAEFTEGLENIGFDSIVGLASPIFLRTVKLKNFPWNGWLTLGVDSRPNSAWNPIAGFKDEFGRLLWSALGDPALLPVPYDSGWMLNRISDVRSSEGR